MNDYPVVGFGFSSEAFRKKWPEFYEKFEEYANEGNSLGELEACFVDDDVILYLRFPNQPWEEHNKDLTMKGCIASAYEDAIGQGVIPSSATEEEFASLDWENHYTTTFM